MIINEVPVDLEGPGCFANVTVVAQNRIEHNFGSEFADCFFQWPDVRCAHRPSVNFTQCLVPSSAVSRTRDLSARSRRP